MLEKNIIASQNHHLREYTHYANNIDYQHLSINSTLEELFLWEESIEVSEKVESITKIFEKTSLLPGLILTQDNLFQGMISRRLFFEYMSRPYSLGLFSRRAIATFYDCLKPEITILSATTSVIDAANIALKRLPPLVYEPIVVEIQTGNYQILDFHQLLIAYSQIHFLTLNSLQQSEIKSQATQDNLNWLQNNHTQIVQAEKMSALGQLVAGIAHEINNPISFITGNIHYVRTYFNGLLDLINAYRRLNPVPSQEIENYLQDVDIDFIAEDLPNLFNSMTNGSERIRTIISSLRNFSRLDETGKKAARIHEDIDNTLLLLQHRLKNKFNPRPIQNINVIKNYGDIPLINCYPAELNQVFMNILINAIDAIEEKYHNYSTNVSNHVCDCPIDEGIEGKITITTQQINIYDIPYLSISIIDNGIGMNEEVSKSVFNPFFTTKEVGKGTGLGMAISYQIIVEKHGGKLECLSVPGQGTEFIIHIPI
ncbi:ATP-binding protein [Calothrix sp. 336/3]|nr:ATP-binding protein [Calothrix sp. 336/3]